MSPADLALLAAALIGAGVLSGLLAGIFGVGGGTVIVPVLYDVFRLMGVAEDVRMPLCVGTSLAIIIPTSIRSFRSHLAKGAVDMDVLRVWLAPVVGGVIIGVVVAAHAPAWLFKAVFVLVAGILSVKLLFGRQNWVLGDTLPGKALMRAYGVVIGLTSALIGIGGGAISNLLLSLYRRPIHQSVATSSGLGVIISIPAMIGYVIGGWSITPQLPPFSLGYVSLIGAALIIPTSMLAAPWGVRAAHALSQRRLEVAFGLYLLFVAARFFISLLN
ncbi:sulfite exporter TauE/SafE family protein [Sphingobium sp. DEHP117]|uniref:sulfite exporter TauE/SafE family protein n=1 Tax=Sphingobium sp. DEHP117 TaxID=2993436 RepID=UPI0027D52D5B|nr:TSUP family transporter [Sphingobium sp. DEHP117]MDQ4419688.1 sulfite exporter TauE/SafE family protein [Sphingobium sp. DEHP117]